MLGILTCKDCRHWFKFGEAGMCRDPKMKSEPGVISIPEKRERKGVLITGSEYTCIYLDKLNTVKGEHNG